jgi:hypothetical protein
LSFLAADASPSGANQPQGPLGAHAKLSAPPDLFGDLNPSPRLLLGPGPVNAEPRVLRAMSMPLLGQFDPEFTAYMDETMALLRRLYQTFARHALA